MRGRGTRRPSGLPKPISSHPGSRKRKQASSPSTASHAITSTPSAVAFQHLLLPPPTIAIQRSGEERNLRKSIIRRHITEYPARGSLHFASSPSGHGEEEHRWRTQQIQHRHSKQRHHPAHPVGRSRRGSGRGWLLLTHFSNKHQPDGMAMARIAPHLSLLERSPHPPRCHLGHPSHRTS